MLNVKKTLTKLLEAILGLETQQISYQVANNSQISLVGGSARVSVLPDGDYIVYFSFGFRTNTTRGASTSVFRLVSTDGYVIEALNPYFFTCTTNGVVGFSFTNNADYWFNTSAQWNANMDFRVSGVGRMRKTNVQA